MYNKVEICGVNTSKLKTLSEDEKRELLKKSKGGDNRAREELIDGNLRLVLSIVQRFTNRKENPDDLFQVGCVGLIKAVDNFNTDLDVKFSTYAVPINVRQRKKLPIFRGLLCCKLFSFCFFGFCFDRLVVFCLLFGDDCARDHISDIYKSFND